MGGRARDITAGSDWPELARRLAGRVSVVVGAPSSGKSSLVAYAWRRLVAAGHRVARITGDPGQPAFGVPTCVAAAWGRSRRARALWFVGSPSPGGHLLQTVVGVGRLAACARRAGADTIVVDASGLVAGQVGRVLISHTLFAAGADAAVWVKRGDEKEDLQGLLEALGVEVFVTRSPLPRPRDMEERRAYREKLWAAHFASSAARKLDARRVLDPAWAPLAEAERPDAFSGAVAGLIGADGFCLGLGIVQSASRNDVVIETAVRKTLEPASVRIARCDAAEVIA